MLTIALCAGEASGDQLGAQLVEELRRRWPQARFYGIGGAHMVAAGVELVAGYQPLAVMGYWDALRSLPAILRLRQRFIRRTQAMRPDIFIGIDAPDFNLGLARRLRRGGSRCIQYVVPSVWMWRRQRLRKISRAVDAVLCLLPFEKPLYAAAGVRTYYVGHPAARRSWPARDEARRRLALAAEDLVIALLPGSRESELRCHVPLLQEVVPRLSALLPQVRFVAALPDTASAAWFQRMVPQAVCGNLEAVLAAADVAVVKSGTVALEAAMAAAPLLVFYRPRRIAQWLARWRSFYLPYFSLPNILSRRFIAAELLLDEANSDQMVREIRRLATDHAVRQRQREEFGLIREALAAADCSPAAAVIDVMAH